MTFGILIWLFVLATALHNFEEALWLPTWSLRAGRWHSVVSSSQFRGAVIVLTLFAALCAFLARVGGKGSVGAYLVTGYALTMLLNVLAPHVTASLVMRRYMPGTATALLFNLPATLLLLRAAFVEHQIEMGVFLWAGPLVVLSILVSIPVLFYLFRNDVGRSSS